MWLIIFIFIFFLWCSSPQWARASSFTRFLDHTQRRITVGRTPLNEWSARRRDLYLTIHNTHNRQTSMSPVGFEPTISAGERQQTYALDRAAIGTGEYGWLLEMQMYHTNVHLFSRNRTRKITEVFINDTNLIAYPEYCIRSFLSKSLLMISFTKV